MDKQIAVLSTGAIGSSIGADLSHAGYNVCLVDQWPAHVEAMKANGLHVKMPDSELHTKVEAYHLCELSSAKKQFDIVLLAAKSHDTRWLCEFIKPYLKDDGMIVGAQNGMNNADIIDKLLYTILGHLGKKGSRTARGVVLQDFLKGRRTETNFLNGHIARKGREKNIPTSANDAIVELVRRIERGELKPDKSNVEVIAKLMG
jgi:ketopantoate reductase